MRQSQRGFDVAQLLVAAARARLLRAALLALRVARFLLRRVVEEPREQVRAEVRARRRKHVAAAIADDAARKVVDDLRWRQRAGQQEVVLLLLVVLLVLLRGRALAPREIARSEGVSCSVRLSRQNGLKKRSLERRCTSSNASANSCGCSRSTEHRSSPKAMNVKMSIVCRKNMSWHARAQA